MPLVESTVQCFTCICRACGNEVTSHTIERQGRHFRMHAACTTHGICTQCAKRERASPAQAEGTQVQPCVAHWALLWTICIARDVGVHAMPQRVLTALCVRCCAQCDVSPAHTQYMLTLKVAETWPVCIVCNGWVMLLVRMGKTRSGGIIWGEVVMMHTKKFPISMYFFWTDHMSMNSVLLALGGALSAWRAQCNYLGVWPY